MRGQGRGRGEGASEGRGRRGGLEVQLSVM